MAGIQAWFAPLLWIIATITAIVAFVRLCKPVWNFFSSPKALSEKLDATWDKMDAGFTQINNRLDQHEREFEQIHDKLDKSDQVSLSLLHDSIVQIYQHARDSRKLEDDDYRRACDLYAQDGESPYIDSLMKELHRMHSKEALG